MPFLNAYSQTQLGQESAQDSVHQNINRFKPRPKFFEIGFESFDDFEVKAESDLIGDAEATVSENLIRQTKLKFPLILKDGLNLVGGFGYRHEQFKFQNLTDPNYPLFERFEDKSLKRLSFSLYLQKDLKGNKFLFMNMSSSLNSDIPGFRYFSNQLKLSITTIKGRQLTKNKQMGWGASFGYDFGQPAAFPVFMLNNDFAPKWGYELILPKSAKLRFSPNNSNHFITSLELKGASYHLRDSVFAEFDAVEFRRSSIRLTLSYEREIYDWLWFGVTGGYRMPINIFLSEPRKRRRDALITVDAANALYYNFSIFLVPPKKLYEKAGRR